MFVLIVMFASRVARLAIMTFFLLVFFIMLRDI